MVTGPADWFESRIPSKMQNVPHTLEFGNKQAKFASRLQLISEASRETRRESLPAQDQQLLFAFPPGLQLFNIFRGFSSKGLLLLNA